MIRITLLLVLSMCYITAFGQTVVWSEDFGTPTSGTQANNYVSANGTWTITQQGFNGSEANVWYVSGEECGNAAGACGSVCTNGDASLHLGANPTLGGDLGAAYAAGGLGFFFVETHKRVESPVINLTGQTNLTLNFVYIEDIVGQAGYDAADDATLWYFDGATWSLLDPLAVTPAGCNPQGTWTAFSIALPASANNNPNVQIGFEWYNDDDNVGTDPSFAVDDIEITTPSTAQPPVASFTPSATNLCETDCITFTDNSSSTASGGISSWDWTFNGGAPATATGQNPGSICYATAGTYDVTLTVTDANGTDDTTIQITVTNCGQPTASFIPSSTTLCENDCITFTDNSTGTNISAWNWTFNGGSPASGIGQNPGSVCWSTAGTYGITLSITDANGTDDTTIQITVQACNTPIADFTYQANICEGQCIDFTDASSGTPDTWEWTFNGATPSSSSDQNPTNICFNAAGTYDIELIVSNSNGSDTITYQIVVNSLPTVDAGTDVTIDIGMSTTLSALGSGSGTYSWSPSAGLSCTNCQAPIANPIVTTNYTVTFTDANGCSASDVVTVFVNVEEGVGVPNAFSPNGDGQNDILFVRGAGIERMYFAVYNRYGQKVFETTEQAVGWDGKHNGKEVNSGVFGFVLEYNFFGKETQKLTGNISLLK